MNVMSDSVANDSKSADSIGGQEFALAEFVALREEILKQTEIQHQIISICIISAGTFFSISGKVPQTVCLMFPLLATCLSSAWSLCDVRIRQIAKYIRESIEPRFHLGWEHFLVARRGNNRVDGRSRAFAIGIVLGTQLLAIILFFVLAGQRVNATELVFVGIDVCAMALSVFLMTGTGIFRSD
jgi:hypothetical protein